MSNKKKVKVSEEKKKIEVSKELKMTFLSLVFLAVIYIILKLF